MEHKSNLEGSDDKNKNNLDFDKQQAEKQDDLDNKAESMETSNARELFDEKIANKTTADEVETQEGRTKMIKNLISAVIILTGIAAGSFFIDIIQFISGSGYSEKALKEAQVFVAGDKTWVAFEDPAIEVEVLTVGDEELESCSDCDPSEVLLWLRRFIPTLVSKKVDASSAPMSHAPPRVVPSTSVVKFRFASLERSVPRFLAVVSEEGR